MSDRLPGHALKHEGAPYAFNEKGGIDRVGTGYGGVGVGGFGRALCQCGATSELLDSGYQRRQWHRDHKVAVRRAAE